VIPFRGREERRRFPILSLFCNARTRFQAPSTLPSLFKPCHLAEFWSGVLTLPSPVTWPNVERCLVAEGPCTSCNS